MYTVMKSKNTITETSYTPTSAVVSCGCAGCSAFQTKEFIFKEYDTEDALLEAIRGYKNPFYEQHKSCGGC